VFLIPLKEWRRVGMSRKRGSVPSRLRLRESGRRLILISIALVEKRGFGFAPKAALLEPTEKVRCGRVVLLRAVSKAGLLFPRLFFLWDYQGELS
jgi:hypothetical protein